MVSSNKAQSELTPLIVSIREKAYALKEEQEDEWQVKVMTSQLLIVLVVSNICSYGHVKSFLDLVKRGQLLLR